MSTEMFRLQPIALSALLIGGVVMMLACAAPATQSNLKGKNGAFAAAN